MEKFPQLCLPLAWSNSLSWSHHHKTNPPFSKNQQQQIRKKANWFFEETETKSPKVVVSRSNPTHLFQKCQTSQVKKGASLQETLGRKSTSMRNNKSCKAIFLAQTRNLPARPTIAAPPHSNSRSRRRGIYRGHQAINSSTPLETGYICCWSCISRMLSQTRWSYVCDSWVDVKIYS